LDNYIKRRLLRWVRCKTGVIKGLWIFEIFCNCQTDSPKKRQMRSKSHSANGGFFVTMFASSKCVFQHFYRNKFHFYCIVTKYIYKNSPLMVQLQCRLRTRSSLRSWWPWCIHLGNCSRKRSTEMTQRPLGCIWRQCPATLEGRFCHPANTYQLSILKSFSTEGLRVFQFRFKKLPLR